MQRATHTRMRKHSLHRAAEVAVCGFLIGSFAWTPTVHAQALVPGKGHGEVSVSYYDAATDRLQLTLDSSEPDHLITEHALILDFDYGLSDRWAINISLPYISKRHRGADPHNPLTDLDDPHGEHLIDDGNFHSGYQDWGLDLRYQWLDGPWVVTPFIGFGTPSHNYVTYAHSALGNHQNQLRFGVNVQKRMPPPWQNLYFEGQYKYAYEQNRSIRRVNNGTLTLTMGYLFSPDISAHASLVGFQTYHGYDFPTYATLTNFRDDVWFHHDELLAQKSVIANVGMDYRLGDHYMISAEYGQMVWGSGVHWITHSMTIGITRDF